MKDDQLGEVPVAVDDRGHGHPFLLLHGGGGPATMQQFAGLICERPARALSPTHPGFNSTERPGSLSDIRSLARVYAALVEDLQLDDVTVIGQSLGGWIAMELALLRPPSVSGMVLLDAVGVEVAGHPVADVNGLTPRELMQRSFHDPRPFLRDPSTMSEDERVALASNQVARASYAPVMSDPTLLERLNGVGTPVLVIWGESDGIVDVEYGRAYADAIPTSRFEVLPGVGHVPQMEAPEVLLDVIWSAHLDPEFPLTFAEASPDAIGFSQACREYRP